MVISSIGRYRFTKTTVWRGVNCAETNPEGSVIRVTQIDREWHKIMGPGFPDWQYWEQPVERVGE